MGRRAKNWETAKNARRLAVVTRIIDELQGFWPLTLRQVYYRLVACGEIENTRSMYGMLSDLLKWARVDGRIPWEALEDRVRVYHNATGWRDADAFTRNQLRRFLTGYWRDVQQGQPRYLEVWVEKDALSALVTRAANPYGVSTVVARGYCSVSFLAAYQERVEARANQLPLVLYLGDHDPSGVQMQDANQQTLADELGCEVEFKRVALLAEDVVRYDLPVNPDALKKTDTRAGAFVAQYGEVAVELDALPPATLVERIQQAIEENLDLPAFNRQVELWRSETAELEQRRRIAMDALGMTA